MHNDWKTHDVFNQYQEVTGYNLFTSDNVLTGYFERNAPAYCEKLSELGAALSAEDTYKLADRANKVLPVLHAYDNRGHRLDVVEFDPAWHYFRSLCKTSGLISAPFSSEQPFRWAYSSAIFMMQTQLEAGALCPATMTLASIPVIAKEPALWSALKDKLLSCEYDDRDVPIANKTSIWIGMGVTEKQGGSDVRSVTTRATPVAEGGRGNAYRITGHKWFFSAPMSDAHLVVATATDTGELSCFFMPRWKPDGTKNNMQIQRLKDKVGNRSNASCEIEFKDAYGILIGEEGRGIPTIIEMANITRFCCVLGSAGIMRQATVQAIAYARRREAFGKKLYGQPLMRNVLTDLALECEAAELLALCLSEAFEKGDEHESSKAWKRFVTPAAKYYVCKRAEAVTAETMEVFGGNGYIRDGIMSRLYLEAPVNSIWEGSGNIMCLDVMRVLTKSPDLVQRLIEELEDLAGADVLIKNAISQLQAMRRWQPAKLEASARLFTEKLILVVQACLLKRYSPDFMSAAFIRLRLSEEASSQFGSFDPQPIEWQAILERSFAM